MGRLHDLAQRIERTLYDAFGAWILAVSRTVDALVVDVAALGITVGALVAAPANLVYGPTGQETVASVTSTPGWTVVGAFYLEAAVDEAIFEAIFLVTSGAVTGRVKLFDTVVSADVAGSVLSSSSTIDVRLISSDLAAAMPGGRVYQVQAEATGGLGQFVVVRAAKLSAERS